MRPNAGGYRGFSGGRRRNHSVDRCASHASVDLGDAQHQMSRLVSFPVIPELVPGTNDGRKKPRICNAIGGRDKPGHDELGKCHGEAVVFARRLISIGPITQLPIWDGRMAGLVYTTFNRSKSL